jgi:hypothetical protein
MLSEGIPHLLAQRLLTWSLRDKELAVFVMLLVELLHVVLSTRVLLRLVLSSVSTLRGANCMDYGQRLMEVGWRDSLRHLDRMQVSRRTLIEDV